MYESTLTAKEILAQNLKAYRLYFQQSQLRMSKRVHMSYRGYGKLERLEVAASLDTLDKVANYLGLPPAILLCPNMIRSMQKTNPEILARLKKMMDDMDAYETLMQMEEEGARVDEYAQLEEDPEDLRILQETPEEAVTLDHNIDDNDV